MNETQTQVERYEKDQECLLEKLGDLDERMKCVVEFETGLEKLTKVKIDLTQPVTTDRKEFYFSIIQFIDNQKHEIITN